jgi:flagellar hook assembly protein FlgD
VTVRDGNLLVICLVAKDGSFSTTVELAYGANNITVTATLEGMEPVTETITVTRVLAVEITSPENGAELTESPVTVNGTVSDANATVTVNGTAVEVASDGSFSAEIGLTEGENTIEAVAVLVEQEASDSITVTYTPA